MSNPPRRSRRLGQPPRQTSTKRQSRQNNGIEFSSLNAAVSIIAGPDLSSSASPSSRFFQYTQGSTSPFGVTRIVVRPHPVVGASSPRIARTIGSLHTASGQDSSSP